MLKIYSRLKNPALSGLLLVLITSLFAPNIQAQDISFGVKSGINFANHYDSQFETDHITTIRLGAYTNVRLGNTRFAIQPELFYSQNGSESSYQSGDIVFRGNYRTDYIIVPMLIHYSLDFSRELQAGLFAGPAVSFLLRSKFSGPQIDTDLMEITNNTDFGVVGGVEFRSPALSDRLSLELRFSRGFSELYDSGTNPEGNGAFSRANKNTAISILLGFAF